METDAYSPRAKFFHWSIVVLVSLQYLTAMIMPGIRRLSTPDLSVDLHMSFGLMVMPIAFSLLLTRLLTPPKKNEVIMPEWQRYAASAMHYLLYVLLIILPLSGWAYASSHGLPVRIFGFVGLPPILAVGSPYARSIGDMHTVLAWTIGILVTGHIVAALHHHFVAKDNILVRMLPHWFIKISSIR